jgi:hypothetical protein
MPSWNSREELVNQIGRLSQVGGISPFTHAEGKAKGTGTLRVRTAQGFEFWVVPDKGMDIYEANFKGQSLCWHSPTGIVHPAYYSNHGAEWLKSFGGGLLTTCGLTTVGAPSEDDGESLGLHGPISNTPAENVSWSETWKDDDCILTVSGCVRETSVHGPNLLLRRTITSSLKSTSLAIHDVVENQGTRSTPLMILYHFNFGFPLLTPRSKIYAPSTAIESVTTLAAASVGEWDLFEVPEMGQQERVYFHKMNQGTSNIISVVLVSDQQDPNLAVALRYDPSTLPRFNQWKMTGANHFVLGLEPANCNTLGREREREQETLQILAPGDWKEFRTEIRVLEGKEAVEDAIRLTERAKT